MENKKAYPTLDNNDHAGQIKMFDDGMDLRDYFAAKAMQSLISTDLDTHRCLKEHESEMTNDIAKASYKISDAMMKARNQTNHD